MKTKEEFLESLYRKTRGKMDVGSGLAYTQEFTLLAMEEYANQSKWISVEERLPETESVVLGWARRENIDSDFSQEFCYLERGKYWYVVNNGDYNDGGYGEPYRAEVTHWHPLPSPPIQSTPKPKK